MERRLIAVTGPEAAEFLQGLVTADIDRATGGRLAWAALLTPQGKYLADFFVLGRPEGFWLDAHPAQADDLLRRLGLYRLRAQVEIAPVEAAVARGTGPAPAGALADPRHEAMGWRLYGGRPGALGMISIFRHVIAHLAITGGMAAGDTLLQQMLGHGIAARLSQRLGEGVLNGLLTARLGLAAIDVTRPLPFTALPRPALSDLAGDLLRKRDEQS